MDLVQHLPRIGHIQRCENFLRDQQPIGHCRIRMSHSDPQSGVLRKQSGSVLGNLFAQWPEHIHDGKGEPILRGNWSARLA
ncbi:MAG: hypothetical protein MJH08_17065 [Hyphomicrobiales bacterium]|nr:hypothetical protein [Hyphomicrobiales bacterium]